MSSRNREKRQKRRRRKKMKASVRNALLVTLCVVLFGSYVGYRFYTGVNKEDLFGDIGGGQDLQEDDSFVLTSGAITYTVYSVGEGEAILIQNSGTEALIDTGTKESSESLVKKLKGKIHGDLEYLVLTSPSEGRLGGLEAVCENFNIKNCIVGEMRDQEKFVWRNISKAGKVINGDNLSYDIGGAATLFIIKPDVSSDDPGDRSLVTYFNYGTTGFLALSDAGKEEISRAFGNVSDVSVIVPARFGEEGVNRVVPDGRYAYVAVSNTSKSKPASGSLSEVISGTTYVTGVVDDLVFMSDGSKVTLTGEELKEDRLDAIDDKRKEVEDEAKKKEREEERARGPAPEIEGIPADEEGLSEELQQEG